jgi:tellurite resistance protein TerC
MPIYAWLAFVAVVVVLLAIDLGVFHRKSHTVSFKEALTWTIIWIILSSIFGAWLWNAQGSAKGIEFFTGYLIELSLSADNVFVFALIFNYFAVPANYQHKVLFWGILSAIVLRLIMILAGAALITQFTWIIYLFAAFLIITALKMLFSGDEEVHPERNPIVRWFRRVVPGTPDFRGDRFWVRENGKLLATPLLVVLVCVEISDVIFAVDSIPAIFAVTRDPFIVFTSNICAILGLRSLYFVLAGVMNRFIYLKTGLALVLGFVGIKMVLSHTAWKIDSIISLGVVALILATSVIASLYATRERPGDKSSSSPE